MERKIMFIANGARWFDRLNGNTYHSVRVTNTETGETIYCPMQYGYGDHYRQTALEEMHNKGWIPGERENLWLFERENNYPIHWTVTDGLKRDCVRNGKE